MTLDEAIRHCEEVAEAKEEEAQDLEYSKLDWKVESNRCSKCADGHRQLAEWLKELKAIKEKDCDDIEETVSTLEYIKEYCHADYEEDALDKAIEMFSKREFHADHTDCIWYRSDKKHTDCPITCSQYRDGWNDAMRYIYEDGAGYKPFRRS